jgi:ubiquinone/menaquinone biosynthesis C-methylase UbiE
MDQKAKETSRVWRSKDQARLAYNRLSRWYDLLAGWAERPARETALGLLAARPGETVLEIGFGTGASLVKLAEAVGAGGKVYGLDLSEGMLRVAGRRLARSGLAGRVELRRGDAAGLPYPASTFDAVFLSFTLELFDTPEIPIVLRESRRVLRDSGRLVVVAMSKDAGSPLARLAVRLYEWAHDRFPAAADCRPIFPARAVSEAGFEVRRQRTLSMWGLPVAVVEASTSGGTGGGMGAGAGADAGAGAPDV